MNEPTPPPSAESKALARPSGSYLPMQEMPQLDDWAAMGKAFEGMCKAGLALTVGFSVAAAFCKMMDSKNANIPSVVNRLAASVFNQGEEKESEKPR